MSIKQFPTADGFTTIKGKKKKKKHNLLYVFMLHCHILYICPYELKMRTTKQRYSIQSNGSLQRTHHNPTMYKCRSFGVMKMNQIVFNKINMLNNHTYRARQAMFNSSKNVRKTMVIATRKSCCIFIYVP